MTGQVRSSRVCVPPPCLNSTLGDLHRASVGDSVIVKGLKRGRARLFETAIGNVL
jgi:hypothetical protein